MRNGNSAPLDKSNFFFKQLTLEINGCITYLKISKKNRAAFPRIYQLRLLTTRRNRTHRKIDSASSFLPSKLDYKLKHLCDLISFWEFSLVFALYIYDPPYNRKQNSLTHNGQIEMRGMNEQIIKWSTRGACKSKRSIGILNCTGVMIGEGRKKKVCWAPASQHFNSLVLLICISCVVQQL
jgi:hypothetical protein